MKTTTNRELSASIGALLLTILNLAAQGLPDGKLLEASPFTLAESDIQMLATNVSDIRIVLDAVNLTRITYASDGLKVKGYLAAPKAGPKLPCLIFNRGGNRDDGALTDASAVRLLGRVASWGYVVVGSQYRGAAGGDGQDEYIGADVNDVLNLIPLLASLPQADASRIGVWGHSRGGTMTYQALTRTDKIAAAIVSGALSDAFDNISRRPDIESVFAELVPNYARNKQAALEARSPIHWPGKLHKQTPILLLHGTADWRVHPTQPLRMAQALFENKHPFRLVLLEGADHALSEHRQEADRLRRDWLDRYVRDGAPLPDLTPHGN